MPQATACPSVAQLRNFLVGRVQPEDATVIAEHLLQCDQCVSVLDSLQERDSLVDAIHRTHSSLDHFNQRFVTSLIERIKKMKRANGLDETASASNTPSLVDAARSSAREPEHIRFLSPKQQPDEIGRLGPYRVLKILGSGGMGMVFEVDNPKLGRREALKVINPGLPGEPTARARFLLEAKATATIRHDNIVTIYHVDEANGVPFLTMELLEGKSLDQFLKRSYNPKVSQILRIGREVAKGLAAAHEHGLIHRDIKPGNLWIEPNDGGRVKILDFGLARIAGQDMNLTQSGAIVGTASYMAPEQARSEAKIDHRCDLFSLGCVLYRLCTGQLPFKGHDTVSVLMAVAMVDPDPIETLRPNIPPRLANLTMQLLQKDPADRPASARDVITTIANIERELAETTREQSGADKLQAQSSTEPSSSSSDVAEQPSMPSEAQSVILAQEASEHLEGLDSSSALSQEARPAGNEHRSRRAITIAAAIVFGLLLVAGYMAAPVVIRFATNKGVVEIKVDDPNLEVTVKDQTGKVLNKTSKEEILLTAGEHELDVIIKNSNGETRFGTQKLAINRGGREVLHVQWEQLAQEEPQPKRKNKSPLDALKREDIPKHELAMAGNGDPKNAPEELVAVLGDSRLMHWGSVTGVTVSPDGRTIASSSFDTSIRLWDAKTGNQKHILLGHTAIVWRLAFSPDGKLLASASHDRTVRIWDVQTGNLSTLLPQQSLVSHVAFHPNQDLLAVAADDRNVYIWDLATKRIKKVLEGHADLVTCVTFDPDGKWLASSGSDDIAILWDANSWKMTQKFEGHLGDAHEVVFHPNKKLIATASLDSTVRIWDIENGNAIHTIRHSASIACLAFSPNGKILAFAGYSLPNQLSSPIKLWDMDNMRALHDLPGLGQIHNLAFSPDGSYLASGGWDACVRIWDIKDNRSMVARFGENRGYLHATVLSPDSQAIATTGGDLVVKIWEAKSGRLLQTLDQMGPPIRDIAFHPDGNLLVAAVQDSSEPIKIWETKNWRQRKTSITGFWSSQIRFIGKNTSLMTDGKRLAALNMTTGTTVKEFWGHKSAVLAIAVSPDEKQIATGSEDFTIKLWDPSTCKARLTLIGHKGNVNFVAFDPKGQLLASASDDETVKVWDVDKGSEIVTLEGHTLLVRCVDFSPDGSLLLTAAQPMHPLSCLAHLTLHEQTIWISGGTRTATTAGA